MQGQTSRVRGIVALAFVAAVVACSSSDPSYCDSDSDCRDGLVCGTTNCSGITTCIRPECACTPGGFVNPCGVGGPTCHCENASCERPLDSCGEAVCPGVCTERQSCQFCLEGDTCELVEPCFGSQCIIDPDGQATCRPSECFGFGIQPPLCGSADAPCGPLCPEPDCADKECGEDALTGLSCGECGAHRYCAGYECLQSPAYSLCEGDLQAKPAEVEIQELIGIMPEPQGGTIPDGTYDLVEQREYRPNSIADKYYRSALRFSAGATQVEHIYDPDLQSQADSESPHRLMTMVVEGTTLSFHVDCPDGAAVIFPNYARGFTVDGNALWLFQDALIEIYARRP